MNNAQQWGSADLSDYLRSMEGLADVRAMEREQTLVEVREGIMGLANGPNTARFGDGFEDGLRGALEIIRAMRSK